MRTTDPVGGVPDLARYFGSYQKYYHDLTHYTYHLRRLEAGYSRGDGREELLSAFSFTVDRLAATQKEEAARYGSDALVLAARGIYTEAFRDALLLVSFGLCLRAPAPAFSAILSSCERGDPLFETIVGAAYPDLACPHAEPTFYSVFDGLYNALSASESDRESCVREYLSVWYREKMEGFSFKDLHLETPATDYIGYWCFEAAGAVAALGIEDESFQGHPQYPADLLAFYRA